MSAITLLDQKQVAKMIQLSEDTLRDWRWQRIGPPFLKISPRCVRYDEKKVLEWLEQRKVDPIPKDN